MRRAPTKERDGVLLLDKPSGLSSNQGLQRVKGLLQASKAGHTGTLDPAATGLLVLCFGEATKLAGLGLEQDKTYEACVQLGVTTDTGDAEGQVIKHSEVLVTPQQVEAALAAQRGCVAQVPPMHSALKVAGKPLYQYAREGQEVARKERMVQIHELSLLGLEGARLRIRVSCSKGTYIRVLAEQIGQHLGCGAHLAALRRTRVGGLHIDSAHTLEALQGMAPGDLDKTLAPPEMLIQSMRSVILSAAQEERVRRGQSLEWSAAEQEPVRMHSEQGALIGLGETRNGQLHPKRILLVRRAPQPSIP